MFKEFMPGGAATTDPKLMLDRRDETRPANLSRNLPEGLASVDLPGGPANVDRRWAAASTYKSLSVELPSGADEQEFPVSARDALKLEIRLRAASDDVVASYSALFSIAIFALGAVN